MKAWNAREPYSLPLFPPGIFGRVHDEWSIFQGNRGSIAHGTYLPPEEEFGTDDVDVMSVVVPPREFYLGLQQFGSRGTLEVNDGPWDWVVYEIRKFVGLLLKGNPNVIMMLWLRQDFVGKSSPEWRRLVEIREVFLSKIVVSAFNGYAAAQMKSAMKPAEFRNTGRMGARRKELAARFGYDPKNASHLIRLQRMCRDMLLTGDFVVTRPDAAELVAIKRGEVAMLDISEESDALSAQIQQLAAASSLPEKPDYAAAERYLVETIPAVWARREIRKEQAP